MNHFEIFTNKNQKIPSEQCKFRIL